MTVPLQPLYTPKTRTHLGQSGSISRLGGSFDEQTDAPRGEGSKQLPEEGGASSRPR